MTQVLDWGRNLAMWKRVLINQTGEDVEIWNARVAKQQFVDADALRKWLSDQGVTGYAQSLLVMERFGFPSFVTTPASELIDNQFLERPLLRSIFDDILTASSKIGTTVVQARKTYVSLVTPRRTFARTQVTMQKGLTLALRIEGQSPIGRLVPSKIHPTMRLQVNLASPSEFDDEVYTWLERAYFENA